MKYSKLKKEREAKVSQLIKDCKMFFAFSDEQLAEGMKENPLNPGDKYFALGAGSYLPKSNIQKYEKGCLEIDEWQRKLVEENNMEDEVILYELANHEAFYTGEIEDTFYALAGNYTREKIWKVYNKNYDKYADS